jgi:hypothetical protein
MDGPRPSQKMWTHDWKETSMATTLSEPTTVAPELASYRAAVVHDFHEPLAVEEVPARPLEPGQIRVKVEASGLCLRHL